MKTIKTLICLLLVTFLTSCNGFIAFMNDEAILDKEQMIGKWQLDSKTINGIEQATECELNNTLEFFEDGTVVREIFSLDGVDCLRDVDISTWENLGGSSFRESGTPTWGNLSGSSYRFNGDKIIDFSQNRTNYRIILSYTIDEVTITYRSVYETII